MSEETRPGPPKKMTDRRVTTIRLEQRTWDRLQALATSRGTSAADLIREAVAEWLMRQS